MRRLVACSMLILSAGGLFAADMKDISIYGSVTMGTWLDRTDKFLKDTIERIPTVVYGADTRPDHHLTFVPYGNIGIKYQGSKITTLFELGVQTALQNGYFGGTTSNMFMRVEKYYAYIRLFYAEWYLSDYLTLVVGQNYTPACFFSSNQMYYDNNAFGNTGSMWEGQKPMFQLTAGNMKNQSDLALEAKAALIKVDTCSIEYGSDPFAITNTKFPKVEGSAEGQINSLDAGLPMNINLKVAGGFQQYDLKRTAERAGYNPDAQISDPINCYVYGVHAGCKFGPVNLMGDFAGGQNLGAYGLYVGNPFVYKLSSNSDLTDIFYPIYNKVDPNNGMLKKSNSRAREWDAIVNVKATKNLSFEAGVGSVHADHDDELALNWHDTWAAYLQSEIKVGNIACFTPEIGMYYFGPRRSYGSMIYAGFGTRIDF